MQVDVTETQLPRIVFSEEQYLRPGTKIENAVRSMNPALQMKDEAFVQR